MKKNLHPEQVLCTFTCPCGNTFQAYSNVKERQLDVCSECHPFYTGAQGKKKKTGSVEKFNKKYNLDK